jgi:hypothetical protein
LERAALSICTEIPEEMLHSLIDDGCVIAPVSKASVLSSHMSLAARGFVLSSEFRLWLSSRCRGLASWVEAACKQQLTREYHYSRLWRDEPRTRTLLFKLFSAWQDSVEAVGGNAASAVKVADPTICAFALPVEPHERVTWYQLMDEDVVFFADAARQYTVHFLHPSDASELLIHFDDQNRPPSPPMRALSLL